MTYVSLSGSRSVDRREETTHWQKAGKEEERQWREGSQGGEATSAVDAFSAQTAAQEQQCGPMHRGCVWLQVVDLAYIRLSAALWSCESHACRVLLSRGALCGRVGLTSQTGIGDLMPAILLCAELIGHNQQRPLSDFLPIVCEWPLRGECAVVTGTSRARSVGLQCAANLQSWL